VQSQLGQANAELERANLQLSHNQNLVLRMESSKFWKLRRAWFTVKKQVYKQAS
jgi:hypothetical protein